MQLEGLIDSKTFAVEVQEALRQAILVLEMHKQTRQKLGGHKSAAITGEKRNVQGAIGCSWKSCAIRSSNLKLQIGRPPLPPTPQAQLIEVLFFHY